MSKIHFSDNVPRVLIVDDEESIRYVFRKILTGKGYDVTVAQDAQSACAIIAACEFDVALVDRILPGGVDGIEVIRRIREFYPFCQSILMSAYPTFQSAAQTLEHEVFAYLTKPIQTKEICSVIESAAEKGVRKKELDRRDAVLRSMFTATPNPIVLYDCRHRIIFVNSAFTRCLGYEPADVLGKDLYFVPEADTEAIRSDFTNLKSGATVEEREQKMVCSSGAVRDTTRIVSLCCTENPENAVILVIIRDITEAKKLERQLLQFEKFAELGELSAKLAHEINNPLQIISGYIEVLLERRLDAEVRKYLEHIQDAARAIKKLNCDFVDVARPRPVKISEFLPEESLEQTITLLKNVGQIKHISIQRDYQNDSARITGDRNQLQQVFLNLIFNAAHSMADAFKKEISFKTAYDRTMNFVRISISDTGCGIAPENVDKIFDPFFTTKTENGGTGLGLSVVKTIIERHGGTIEVVSTEGEGTTFTIDLPATAAAGIN